MGRGHACPECHVMGAHKAVTGRAPVGGSRIICSRCLDLHRYNLPLQVSRRSSSRAVSGLSHPWDGLEVLHEAAHSPQGLAPLGQAHLQVTPELGIWRELETLLFAHSGWPELAACWNARPRCSDCSDWQIICALQHTLSVTAGVPCPAGAPEPESICCPAFSQHSQPNALP